MSQTIPAPVDIEGSDVRSCLLDPVEDSRWREFVECSPQACVFHHPRWLALLHRQYGYVLSACCLTDAAGEVCAGLPIAQISSRLTGRRLVALPFSDICAPLSRDGSLGGIEAALQQLHDDTGLELRVHGQLDGLGRPGTAYHHHAMPLEDDVQAVQRRFTRRQALQGVRRAEREGVVVERRTDRETLAAFYRMHVRTRRRQGIPTQPRRFILGLSDLFEAGLGFVSLASVEGRPIAGAVFMVFNGVLTYKYGASDVRFLDRRPNNLLLMDAIRWGCERGLHTFDMGRTDLGHDSLRAFKLMWGCEERPLQYTDVSGTSAARSSAEPRGVSRSLIRHLPPMVSRGLGELFYRHVG